MACHSDESLGLLADVTPDERRILEAIRYLPNTAVLHTDRALLPDRKRAWASWNYHAAFQQQSSQNDSPVSLTYLLNKLQPLPFSSPVMVTMNPLQTIDPARVLVPNVSYVNCKALITLGLPARGHVMGSMKMV
jgi:predicted NAD/FAD-binding protein